MKLILKALDRQSNRNFDVILSEDDYNENTIDFILKNKHLFDFPITHLHQKADKGFRKNEMLNRSIVQSKSNKLAFIDGDCIPHKHFVRAYIKTIQEGYIYIGRAVFLGRKISEQIKEKKSLRKLNFFSLLLTDSRKRKESIYFPLFSLTFKMRGRGLVGRNWGIFKMYLIELNGFDTDYSYPGVGEDDDIAWRLMKYGLKTKSMKNKSIVYHLYHPRWYSEKMVNINVTLFHKKKGENKFFFTFQLLKRLACSRNLSIL